MNNLQIKKNSQWNENQIREYLNDTAFPMRLACLDRNGYPLVCSLWFLFKDGCLWCASHSNSYIVKLLKEDRRCSFEIGVNSPPYMGIRGQGDATLVKERAGEILVGLIKRYPVSEDSSLARWLLSRVADEYAIQIDIKQITAWDYTPRMRSD